MSDAEAWQSDPDAAMAEARRRVAIAAGAEGAAAETLDLTDLPALRALPEEIAGLVRLRRLFAGGPLNALRVPRHEIQLRDISALDGHATLRELHLSLTKVTDLAPLAGLPGLTTLDLSRARVSDLAPLAGLKRLTSLDLGLTPVSDLAPLAGLTGLTTLDLGLTPVSDLAPLAGLKRLTTLDLSRARVSDLAPLAGLPGLTELHLSRTRVTDLSPLAGLPGLTTLDLGGTRVTDLSPLAGLTGLTTLHVSDTQVSDLAPLVALTDLTLLDLSATGVNDLAPLAGLTGLTTLDLRGTRVGDLAPLAGLKRLTSLDLSITQVSDLAPLAGLTGLTKMDLRHTLVSNLAPLLSIPAFAEERAEALYFVGTPAADPETDRRLYMLSRLDLHRCAVETVQYLKGTHPDFQGPPGGGAPAPLADRLAAASPVAVEAPEGRLRAVNAGAPERVAPEELHIRLTALRRHLDQLQDEARARQVPQGIRDRLARYAGPLSDVAPTYLLLDGPMAYLRGGVEDAYVTDALDGGFVEGWRELVRMHDALRPLLLPSEEAALALPELSEDATPEEGIAIADAAVGAMRSPEGAASVEESVVEALTAAKDYFEAATPDSPRRETWLKRGFAAVGGIVAQIVKATPCVAAITVIHTWAVSPAGQAVIAQLRPLLDRIMRLFGG